MPSRFLKMKKKEGIGRTLQPAESPVRPRESTPDNRSNILLIAFNPSSITMTTTPTHHHPIS